MININVDKKAGIPVKIGKLEFMVDTSDSRLEELVAKHDEIAKMFENVGESREEAKKALKKAFTLFLGKGSFKKIYEQTDSLIGCANILAELLELLPQAIESAQAKTRDYETPKKLYKESKLTVPK